MKVTDHTRRFPGLGEIQLKLQGDFEPETMMEAANAAARTLIKAQFAERHEGAAAGAIAAVGATEKRWEFAERSKIPLRPVFKADYTPHDSKRYVNPLAPDPKPTEIYVRRCEQCGFRWVLGSHHENEDCVVCFGITAATELAAECVKAIREMEATCLDIVRKGKRSGW